MKILTATALAVAVAGCSSTVATIHGPDGRLAQSITCSGSDNSWADCYKRASDICKSAGYDILAGGGDTGIYVSRYGSVPTASRAMLVSCKG
jgi:predicted alpha/beta hydrolase